MYAQLGNIIFDGPFSFNGMQENINPVYAEHQLINRKNELQFTGMGLDDITIDLLMRQNFCNVSTQIDQLKTYTETSTTLTLLWGNGKVQGDYKLTGITITYFEQDTNGALIGASVNVKLKEVFIADKLAEIDSYNRAKALAVGKKTAGLGSPVPNKPSIQLVNAKDVQVVNSNGAQANDISNKYSNTGSQNEKLLKNMTEITGKTNDILNMAADPLSGDFFNSPYIMAAENLYSTASKMKTVVETNILGLDENGILSLQNANGFMQADLKIFAAAGLAAVLGVIVRNP